MELAGEEQIDGEDDPSLIEQAAEQGARNSFFQVHERGFAR